MDRELTCAAWFVVADLLSSGTSFPELARIREEQMILTVRKAMAQ